MSGVTVPRAAWRSASGPSVVSDDAAWLTSLEELVPTPPLHRRAILDSSEALGILGCSPSVLSMLIRAGLPHVLTGDGERFDFHDVVNVALYSGSGRSVPEAAERVLMRHSSSDPGTLVEPRDWALSWELSCPASSTCGGAWTTHLPSSGVLGGGSTGLSLALGRPGPRSEGVGGTPPPAVILTGQVSLTGSLQTVVDPLVSDLYAEVLDDLVQGRTRYQWMPRSLQVDLEAVLPNQTLDCVSASLLLDRRCAALGVPSRTRKGVMLGVVGVEHAWAEFLDADGTWKALDPIFALLALRSPRAHPAYGGFCAGSTSSRLLPWNLAADEALAHHDCIAATAPTSVVHALRVDTVPR